MEVQVIVGSSEVHEAAATVPGEEQTLSSNKSAKRFHLPSQSVRIAAKRSLITESGAEKERGGEREREERKGDGMMWKKSVCNLVCV